MSGSDDDGGDEGGKGEVEMVKHDTVRRQRVGGATDSNSNNVLPCLVINAIPVSALGPLHCNLLSLPAYHIPVHTLLYHTSAPDCTWKHLQLHCVRAEGAADEASRVDPGNCNSQNKRRS